ncbi:hypothetical protein GCM10010218_24060 [Streptomyces mashuensis]|uniref:Uncharacterized protein n=1 Tax=Streptomyces mashuensis TaxID=33904 RepID=A0A919ECK8_9ACTN|nr:hypothetical protein [Streptomyces mashuensis]GHF42127.1 hypothetical protein GCM10010218_24060 [Streptomyces mashuensis]
MKKVIAYWFRRRRVRGWSYATAAAAKSVPPRPAYAVTIGAHGIDFVPQTEFTR